MLNTFTCVFEILVSKCKIICRFKISAEAGIQKRQFKPPRSSHNFIDNLWDIQYNLNNLSGGELCPRSLIALG